MSPLVDLFSRQIVTNSKLDLLEDVVYPGALECRALIAEELNEMREQLRKQRTRVRELRVRKVEEPGMSSTSSSCVRQLSRGDKMPSTGWKTPTCTTSTS